MRSFSAGLLAIFMFGALWPPPGLSARLRRPRPTRLQLTVDSIMRGPELVGWPPTELRWSPDSQKLYFSWRKPGDKAAALHVVGRDGGAPRRLSDEEAANAPPANGRWDTARRRLLATEGGDVIIYDGASGTRTFVTRTTGGESSAALGEERHPRDLRARRQPLHPAAAGRIVVARHPAHRRHGEEDRSPAHRQPEFHPR